MDEIKERLLRKERTWTDILPLTFLQAFIWLSIGCLISIILGTAAWGRLFTSDEDVITFMGSYTQFFGIWLAFIFVILIFKGNRPMIRQLWPEKKSRMLKGIVIGLIAGFLLNSVNVAASILMGDLKLAYNGIEIRPLIGFFLFVMIQSGGEEIIDRLFIYQKLRRRYKNPAIAVIGNAVFFLLLHLGNDNINIPSLAELFLWGVLFALIVYYFDNLWMSIAIHTAWNFTQNIIYGLPNSGIVSKYSIWKIDAASNDFFFDTGFGVEGSWGAVLVISIVIGVLILIRRNKEANDIWGGWVNPESLEKKSSTRKEIGKETPADNPAI